MSLRSYHQKRHFDRTPEPPGKPVPAQGPLRFVVQKHAASRLHYDFRLEVDGALKSWAVPKGPSLRPEDKRLAMMVEDHPLDYRTFEGIIPKGNYGAGTVMVWDEGTYCARETADRHESERLLREGLRQGHLSVVLNGQKLRGEFSLVKLNGQQDNAWLLIKKRDAWASDVDVTQQSNSVTSSRSLDEIAGKVAKQRPKALLKPRRTRDRKGASESKMPRRIKPMLATLAQEAFDRPGWLFEIKWDGYRAIAEVTSEGVSLYSRNHQSFAERFVPLLESLRRLDHEAVLDGEIVVLDAHGRSHFQLLQNYQKTGQGQLRYYVFDLLWLDGQDLRTVPLTRRKELLGQVIEGLPNVLLSEHVHDQGVAFFEAAASQGLEGIMAKNGKSPYCEGVRSQEWLKIKAHRRQEAVICGFTEPRGSRKNLGALVLGVYQNEALVYIGHTGGGLDSQGLWDLRARLEPLVQRKCPFATKPRTNAPVHWVAPRLVCEVSFQEWTADGRLRQPIFVGLREDKPAHTVRREEPRRVPQAGEERKPRRSRSQGPTKVSQTTARPRKANNPPSPSRGGNRRSLTASDTVAPGVSKAWQPHKAAIALVPHPALTNLDKVFWPQEGFTKGDLLAYYREVAPIILPYLRDRPQSLHRHPNGIAGKSFFQKDVSRQPPPSWVQTVTLAPESASEAITYLLCQDEPSLLYLVNLGCIELNPWNSRITALENPDYLVLDLDPEDIPFARVVEAAIAVHQTLATCGAESFCKTSGKRGLHVFVPLGARYSYEHAKQFAQIIAKVVHRKLPHSTSLERSPKQRQGRVYLDFLQNRRGQTLAAPYAVRPYPGATVSTPLRWSEVRKGLDPARFTMRTLRKRLDKVGDLWQPVLSTGIDLIACLERLAKQEKSKPLPLA